MSAELHGESPYSEEEEAVRMVLRGAMYKGSDVRLATGLLHDPAGWPRRSYDVNRWSWKVVISAGVRHRHINVQELRGVLATFKWRTRSASGIRIRCLHIVDSQVSMGVLVKGRSSSSQLCAVLRRINALLLSAGVFPSYAWVRSADNPADSPSRWPLRSRS